MKILKFIKYNEEKHLEAVKNLELRSIDSLENYWSTGIQDDLIVLDQSIKVSDEIYVITLDGEVEGVCGVASGEKALDGMVWMLTAREFPEYTLKFFRETEKLVQRWFETYESLFNFISVRRPEDYKFLEMLGFVIEKEVVVTNEETGEDFYLFSRLKGDEWYNV